MDIDMEMKMETIGIEDADETGRGGVSASGNLKYIGGCARGGCLCFAYQTDHDLDHHLIDAIVSL